jgi:hypothetical protein
MSDYLPAPHGLPGFAAPVEQIYPSLVPYIELADGRTVVAGDGADVIEPARDERSLRVRWTRWAVVGKPSGTVEDVGLTSEVVWRIEKGTLARDETLSSKQTVSIRRWRLAIPSTHSNFDMEGLKEGLLRFQSPKGSLDVVFGADFPVQARVVAAGDTAIGRGVHGAIPLHLVYEGRDLNVSPRSPLRSRLTLTPSRQDYRIRQD